MSGRADGKWTRTLLVDMLTGRTDIGSGKRRTAVECRMLEQSSSSLLTPASLNLLVWRMIDARVLQETYELFKVSGRSRAAKVTSAAKAGVELGENAHNCLKASLSLGPVSFRAWCEEMPQMLEMCAELKKIRPASTKRRRSRGVTAESPTLSVADFSSGQQGERGRNETVPKKRMSRKVVRTFADLDDFVSESATKVAHRQMDTESETPREGE